MGRPGLSQNKKFRRLALELRSPATARGHLELMWDSAYESGDEVLGDSLDVELAAAWKGKSGVLCDLLARTGFIDESEGVYTIHDFWHHAPSYVSKRKSREVLREKPRPCAHCGLVFHSSDARAQYCSPACRTAAYRDRHSDGAVTDASVTVTDCDTTPSPSPSPSPSPKEVTTTPRKARTGRRSRVEILQPFGPDVVMVVNTLLDEWKTEDPEDGRPIKAGPEDTGKAVDGILKSQPNVTPDMLLKAGRDYIASPRMRYKAPQYFFGPQGPWDGFVRAQMTACEVPHAR